MDKRHILNEIKRTAAANGGVPLGRLAFFNETGIREFDWRGRYWARWNDAVREAGLAPNRKTEPRADHLMLEKLIGLMRELGRVPIISEMRLKKASDSTFPNDRTFKRFGTKQQLVATLLEYCTGREGYEDVVSMCEAVTGRTPPTSSEGDSKEVFGFVYLFKSGRHYKIGHSNSVGRREYELAIQLPEKLALIHSIRTDDPAGIEGYWHKRFADRRGNGEWFKLTGDDVRVFKRRKFM